MLCHNPLESTGANIARSPASRNNAKLAGSR